MARPVLRLSPLAKAGATVLLAGVALAVYAELSGAGWAVPASRGVVLAGFALYVVARVRMLRKRRSGPPGGSP